MGEPEKGKIDKIVPNLPHNIGNHDIPEIVPKTSKVNNEKENYRK